MTSRTTSMLRSLMVFTLALALFGCSDDGQAPDTGGGDLGADAGVDSRPPDKGPAPDSPPTAEICGKMVQISTKTPIAKGDLILCNENECHSGTSATDGSFCLHVDVEGDYVLHALETKIAGKRYGDVVLPVKVSAAEISARAKVDVGSTVLPIMGTTVMFDPKVGGNLDLGDGVKLTIPAKAATLPALMDKAEVAMVKVDPKDVHPRLLATRTATPDLVYAIIPLEVYFSPSISFELPAGSLTAGTNLEIFLFDYAKGKLVASGEGTVGAAGTITEVTGKGLVGLGWLMFYKK